MSKLTRGGGSGALLTILKHLFFFYQLTELLGKLFNGQPSCRSPLQRHYLTPLVSSSARFTRCKDYARRRLQARPSDDRVYFSCSQEALAVSASKGTRQSDSLVKTQCTITGHTAHNSPDDRSLTVYCTGNYDTGVRGILW